MALDHKNKRIKPIPVIFLLLTNMIPLMGFLFFDWDLFYILFFYWLENLAIGMINVLKILKAEGKNKRETSFKNSSDTLYKLPLVFKPRSVRTADQAPEIPKVLLVFFFVMHYGLFTIVHGLFILVLFGKNSPWIGLQIVTLTGVSMFVSHFISYLYNFLGQKEYQNISPTQAMIVPYKRIVVIHLTVLSAGFVAVIASGIEFIVLLILILLKTVIDLTTHISEHSGPSS